MLVHLYTTSLSLGGSITINFLESAITKMDEGYVRHAEEYGLRRSVDPHNFLCLDIKLHGLTHALKMNYGVSLHLEK